MLLAIDTSTRQAGVALFDGARGLLAEYNWHSANRHTEELIPAIDLLLGGAAASPADLLAVGVALGPGSFSGLRVGLAAAKGLALAHGVKLVGVPTTDIVAYPHQAQTLPLIAVVQAGRGRVYWAPYGRGQDGWRASAGVALGTLSEVAESLVTASVIAGELTVADRDLLKSQAGARAVFLPSSLSIRRAGCLAELAWQRYMKGEFEDPATLSPLYLQQPEGAKPGGIPGAAPS